jgi:hypothetical protein
VPAKRVHAGSLLLSRSGTPLYVHRVRHTTMRGFYAPLTSSGTIIVDHALASCYTGDHYPLPHWAVQLLMIPLRLAPRWLSYQPTPGEIHPFARCLMWLSSYMPASRD